MAQVITTILHDDNPKGLKSIQMDNWSGYAFVVPRGKISELRGRQEAQQPGIYFLFGDDNEKQRAYIGQSENVFNRLYSHDLVREDDDWNTAVIFGGRLDSTSVKFLESNAIALAIRANRCKISNNALPQQNSLSEAQKITVSEYFKRMKMIVGLFGYRIFEDPKEETADHKIYTFATKSAVANGTLLESQEFVVYKGSTARIRETASFSPGGGSRLRKRLLEEKILRILNAESYQFFQDYIFTSPSAAADTIAGRSCNGWTAWKNADGKTLNDDVRN